MKITVTVESTEHGVIHLATPEYVEAEGVEGRAAVAAAYFDFLGPRLLSALSLARAEPGAPLEEEDADVEELRAALSGQDPEK